MAKNLVVVPGKLEDYAKKQDLASGKAAEAAGATSGLGGWCWAYQGVISGVSNGKITDTEKVRSAAGGKISAAAKSLAEKLRAAKLAYEGVDTQMGADINKQMIDK